MPKSKKKQKQWKNQFPNHNGMFWNLFNNALNGPIRPPTPFIGNHLQTNHHLTYQNAMYRRNRYGPNRMNHPAAMMMETEDFTKDLLDVGDSNKIEQKPNTSATTTCTTTLVSTSTTVAVPKLTGKHIPVKMRENVVKRQSVENTAANKQAHLQSNQLLKDCLSSDINTVVKDKIKGKLPNPKWPNYEAGKPKPVQTPSFLLYGGPSGVPRSFLTRPDQMVIEPQSVHVEKTSNYQPTQQKPLYNVPAAQGASVEQALLPNTVQNNPQEANDPNSVAVKPQSPTRYSPTDLYVDCSEEKKNAAQGAQTSPSELMQPGEKRVSAFDRLGPLSQPKTPKLTINLSFNKEQAIREVVDESTSLPAKKEYKPVHQREDILHSVDETVMKYVGAWPWAFNIVTKRTARSKTNHFGARAGDSYSPTAMMMLKEQMDEVYQRDNLFVAVSVTNYPESWTKEDVLDAMLHNLKGKSFIPCFIEFNRYVCKFLVIRCRSALLAIHALDFRIQKDGVQLYISISQISVSVVQLDFIPRLILRKRLSTICCKETKLDLSSFTLQPDVSHFIYYPLNDITNQMELMNLQTDIKWKNLTELDLSRNRLTTIEGFELGKRLPKLQHLDLSHNYIEKVTELLSCRQLLLRSLRLEGNPLCHDYIHPDRYWAVVKMMFPTLKTLDDVPIHEPGKFPTFHPNYCPPDAVEIVDNFLQLFIPLMDSHSDDRVLLYNMYAEDAFVTITYRPKFGSTSEFRYPRSMLLMSRVLLDGGTDFADGRADVEKLLRRWPCFEHDVSSFRLDVMLRTATSLLFRLDGIVKLPANRSLAENDHLVAFSRTILLQTSNGLEYKIKNEMIYWDEPSKESSQAAFRRILVQRKPLGFKFLPPLDEECKKKLIQAFMKLTQLDEKASIRCLDVKDWDFKDALEYFIKLYKTDNLQPLLSNCQ